MPAGDPVNEADDETLCNNKLDAEAGTLTEDDGENTRVSDPLGVALNVLVIILTSEEEVERVIAGDDEPLFVPLDDTVTEVAIEFDDVGVAINDVDDKVDCEAKPLGDSDTVVVIETVDVEDTEGR